VAKLKAIVIASVLAILVLVQGCATNEELFAEYDDAFCAVPERPGEIFRWEPVIYFASDSDNLSVDALAKLKTNLETLKNLPDYKISLKGFADHQASDSYNQRLSGKRVAAVTAALADQLGLDADRVIGSAHGESSPLTEISRGPVQADRRVEMLLLDTALEPVANQPLIRAARK